MWGISSNGRALALHARGTRIDTWILHFVFAYTFSKPYILMCGVLARMVERSPSMQDSPFY